MPVEERWTTRSGPRIRYLDGAPADPVGLPVLFSPGFSDEADEYAATFECFGSRRLLVVEVRGRGRSEAPPTGYAAADHAADLAAVLDEAGVDRFHLMTFSRGTTWGLDLALSRPARVASVSIGDYRAGEVGLPSEVVEHQLAARFRGRPVAERLPRHVVEGVVGASRTRSLWDELVRLPVPLLVARGGGEGSLLDDEDVERYRAVRPDVEVVTVPDAPHDLFRPDRTWYPRAVLDLIARRCPGE
jgi:pimeloyl-ACP methyl ester carboxylesterase